MEPPRSEPRSTLAWEAPCGTRRIGWERRGGHTLGFLESMFGMWSSGGMCRRWSEPSELLARSESSRCRREFPVSSNRRLGLCIMSEKKFWCLAYCLEKWKVEGKKKYQGKRKKKMKILLRGALISSLMVIFSLSSSNSYQIFKNLDPKRMELLTFGPPWPEYKLRNSWCSVKSWPLDWDIWSWCVGSILWLMSRVTPRRQEGQRLAWHS